MHTKTAVRIKWITLVALLAIQAFMFTGIHSNIAYAAAPAQRPDNPEVEVSDDPEYIEAIFLLSMKCFHYS